MSFTVCWDNSGYYINLMTKLKKKRQAGYGINNAKIIHPNIRKIQHQNKSRTEPLEVWQLMPSIPILYRTRTTSANQPWYYSQTNKISQSAMSTIMYI